MMARLLFALLLALPLAPWPAQQAYASDAKVARIDPVLRNGMLEIDANVDIELNDQLREAAERGVPLYFTADLVITTSRWWWFDRTVVETQMTRRVVYNALTRQWRVGTGELSLPVPSLEDAMSLVRSIRGWSVARSDDLDHGVLYEGQLRLRLDTSQLARPFQVNALNSSSWSLSTPWTDFSFALAEAEDDS